MPRSMQDVARELAEAHRIADPSTEIIKWFPSDKGEICLIEVSKSAPATDEILSIRFEADPAHQIDYPSWVILLSPNEWVKLESKLLKLPNNWDTKTLEDL